ncbi:hypothetical protein [Candidatus Methylobacter oryzae]|uniref:Uncharacterized protein n=1 Tax=Candidatus Methylobacter oryzae TaxID=2497749 RepID=A0ABY3C5A0_9GAMM|nr:hypothetical protein [Candidatus Methylobacter oryzae]TRW90038.1 hypothetical protein EKO24_020695 [Candidatus Methylobacter oryzae]
MQDLSDKNIVEIFPLPKKRGRSSTRQAKSSAERQAAYRFRKHHGSDGGQVAINHGNIEQQTCS